MQLHSANDQMTARVNMAFSRPRNYDSLQRLLVPTPSRAYAFSCLRLACVPVLYRLLLKTVARRVHTISRRGEYD